MVMTSSITREVLDSYLRCKTKAYLRLAGNDGAGSEYQRWQVESEERQRLRARANLLARYRGRQISESNVPITSRLLAGGDDLILDGRFENGLISLNFDALVKAESSTTGCQEHYIPVLFHDGPIRTPEKSLIELLALLISEFQERAPNVGLICRSEGKPATIRFTPALAVARSLLREILELHQGLQAPMLVLNNHCHSCIFHDHCRKRAIEDDNLSLLSGMNEVQIKQLNRKGIFTVNQLSYTFRLRRKPKRAKRSSSPHQLPLRALALRESKVFVHGSPSITYPGTRVYLDIEGTPQNNSYYLIGLITISDGHETRDTFWSDTAGEADQIRMFAEFLAHLAQYSDYSLLHYGKYETTALRRIRASMTEPYKRQIDGALARSIDILKVIASHIYFPTYSNSLKEIGGFLGYRWSDPLCSGLQTLVWRDRWLTDHDPPLKSALVQYNYEDCSALKGVAEFLEKIGTNDVPDSSQAAQHAKVTSTSTLPTEKSYWPQYGDLDCALEDFRTINRLSYFDYQRDRVFARTKRPHTGLLGKPAKRRQVSLKPNKIVSLSAAKCPACDSRKIEAMKPKTREVVDLKFTSGGIKRWITRFVSREYRCTHCGTRFVPNAYRRCRKIPKYGRGLISWCIYQLLVGGQNLNRIHRCLRDLFGIKINITQMYLFKGAIAEYFKTGYEKILKELLRGRLIHIDETTINLQKDKGYVWVLASTEAVYFFYRTSREGSFLADMLLRFKGVLVSDFYTAYDALDMPQQRCLIHLMRDMNDDLLKSPFDDELKAIASKFSFLLKDIVQAIDQYGLKKRHLNKYRPRAERFCDWIDNQRFNSDNAKTYARRITKYRNFLFAFLAYDGVPWNNNNAEHAIKSFAKFRRFSNGIATEPTIEAYLILLSIFLTCEYRGIDFLKVLRGDTKGDYGFGSKRGVIPLRIRLPRQRASEPATRASVHESDGDSRNQDHEERKVAALNNFLPVLVERLRGAFHGFNCRVKLAPDLWPVRVEEAQLGELLTIIASNFSETIRPRAAILSARNLRLEKCQPPIGLKGRYVAISISDGGRRVTPQYGQGDKELRGLEVDEIDVVAREFGGAAVKRSFYTGRKIEKTLVTIFVPQYSSRLDISATLRTRETAMSANFTNDQ